MTQTVAIIGATGLQGGSVLHALHATGKYKLVAVTRDVSSESAKDIKAKYPNVELATADIYDPASLEKAFKGADYVFGVTQFFQPAVLEKVGAGNFDAEFDQGKNIIDAAIAVGVKNIVMSTLPSVKELSGGKYSRVLHFDGKYKIEEYLNSKADKICGAAVRVGYYMENYITFSRISPDDNDTVEFSSPLPPTTKIPLIDTAKDTGGVVAYILDNFDDFVGKPFEVSGGYYEAQDMAVAFTEATGKPAKYAQIPHAYLNSEELTQMFKSFEEFGFYGHKTDFLEINEKMDYKHTTPAEFWKNRGWTGPSQ
ncbi:hypothetical protein GGI11_004087 [Coemansia sp. RSA 2049]|nr:hypothetical protein GGI11_004087 [Coemansia sp. RSA 2049]KAJ2521252.1 hypothetical protein H4217_001502 [Coemansia sp. RSA 1939]